MHAQISNLKLQLDSNNISYNKCTCQMENTTGITLVVNFLQIMLLYTIRILASTNLQLLESCLECVFSDTELELL